MSVAEDLAEHLEAQYALPEVDEDEERQGFRFDSDSKADWGLRMLARNRAEQEQVLALAQEQRDRLDEWVEERLKALQADERFFEGGVADYWRRELEPEVVSRMDQGMTLDAAWAAVRTKSRKLPHGTLKGIRGSTKVVLDDVDAFVAWARANDRTDLLTAPAPQPSKTAIAADIDIIAGRAVIDGEVLPGVRIEDPGVRYSAVPTS